MAPTNGYDLIRWANRTPKVPNDRYVGTERVRRILVDLALNSDRHWTTYVSRRRLADDLDIDQRIVGRALTLLTNAGLITVTQRDGRRMSRWRLWPDADLPTGGDSTPQRGDSTRSEFTPTGGDSMPESGDPITPEFGDSTPFGGETGGATGGATGGDFTHPHLYKGSRSGRGSTRTRARAGAREAAGGTPTQEDDPEQQHDVVQQPPTVTNTTRSDEPTDPADMPIGCTRHPEGTDEPCRACQRAARIYDRNEERWKASRCRHHTGCTQPIDRTQPEYQLCARHIAFRQAGQ